MQYIRNEHQSDRSANDSRKKEKTCSSFVTHKPKPLFQILVNRNEIHSIVKWDEHIGNNKVPEEVTKYRLHITELVGSITYPSRNRKKCNATQRSTYHSKRHQEPWRFPFTEEKSIIIRFSRRKVTDGHQHCEITDDNRNDSNRIHKHV